MLFESEEIGQLLRPQDERVRHLLDVLHRAPGEPFDAGILNGTRGRAYLETLTPHGWTWRFEAGPPLPTLRPLHLIVGLPRPQTARDILRDATTLGATALHFVTTARSDLNYARSSLWLTGEWQRHVRAGAMQAFDPRVPVVSWAGTLASLVPTLPGATRRVALDNYEAALPLAEVLRGPAEESLVLAIGPERGWDAADRQCLREGAFSLAHLGPRVLRTETAVVAALSLAQALRGWA